MSHKKRLSRTAIAALSLGFALVTAERAGRVWPLMSAPNATVDDDHRPG